MNSCFYFCLFRCRFYFFYSYLLCLSIMLCARLGKKRFIEKKKTNRQNELHQLFVNERNGQTISLLNFEVNQRNEIYQVKHKHFINFVSLIHFNFSPFVFHSIISWFHRTFPFNFFAAVFHVIWKYCASSTRFSSIWSHSYVCTYQHCTGPIWTEFLTINAHVNKGN